MITSDTKTMKFEGWALTYLTAVIVLLVSALIFLFYGWNDASFHLAMRTTARISFLLFFIAFTASSLNRLWPAKSTQWLRRNRRYIGVSFAVSHTVHLALIITIAFAIPEPFRSEQRIAGVVLGTIAYGFIFAMALTSSNRAQTWFGPGKWQALHKTGGYFILLVFTLTYVKHLMTNPAFYSPFIVAVAAILGLRIVARLRAGGEKI